MPLPKALPTPLPSALSLGVTTLSNQAVITNNGLSLLAQTLISSGTNAVIAYVAIGTGTGTLSGGLTSGVAVTSLPVNALATGITAGQSLTLVSTNGVDTATMTVAVPGALVGATSIPINSFTPSATFLAGSGLLNTPTVNDIQLQAETARVATSAGVVGANPGETLVSGYFDPTIATGTYVEVGYFGGSTATGTVNTGTLVARDLMLWAHTLNADSYTNQLDSTV